MKTPADLVGFKLRVPENDVFKAMAEAWGAKPTPMNFGELYLALKQNVVDGQENPLPTIKSGKFDEVQKYLVLSGHIITPRLVVDERGVLAGPVGGRPQDHRGRREERHRLAERRAHQAGEGRSSTRSRPAGMTVITPDPNAFRAPVLAKVPKMFEAKWGAGHVRAESRPCADSLSRGADARPDARREPRSPRASSTSMAIATFAGMFACVLGQVVSSLLPRRPARPGATSSRATSSSGARSWAGSSPPAAAATSRSASLPRARAAAGAGAARALRRRRCDRVRGGARLVRDAHRAAQSRRRHDDAVLHDGRRLRDRSARRGCGRACTRSPTLRAALARAADADCEPRNDRPDARDPRRRGSSRCSPARRSMPRWGSRASRSCCSPASPAS